MQKIARILQRIAKAFENVLKSLTVKLAWNLHINIVINKGG